MSDAITVSEAPGGAVALIREAIASKADPAYLRELLAVREQWEASEARKTFSAAIAEFQKRAPIIPKSDQGDKSNYAKLDRIWRTVRPILTDLGLSVTWQICELRDGNLCHVEGKLAHKDGHSDRIVFDVPVPEPIRSREGKLVTNVAQSMGSAHTYAQRYATCSALGIVCGEDDDGKNAGTAFVTSDQAQEIAELVDAARRVAGFNEAAFWKFVGAERAQDVAANRFGDVIGALKRKLKG